MAKVIVVYRAGTASWTDSDDMEYLYAKCQK